ncbi:sugar transferase [Corynebacterium pilosum]|uniref:Sugar transferase n=1 Tax=Corynebacterium pilosum TaxID=35756 RepID=A0A376CM76_9CORY|nr:sugar transferase [Corynebacterium pilosum]STC68778.1 sugar transferase [Corynebacterium pilosum]
MAMALRGTARRFPAVSGGSRTYFYRPLKRIGDVAVSATALIVLAPLMVFVALVIKLDDGGPVLFRQRRIGYQGEDFTMLKFRTMRTDAEDVLPEVTHHIAGTELESEPKLFKLKDDPRIIRSGKFLRQSSLDELPQLFNVLVGQMSLIGPRPPLPREYAQYCDEEKRRMSVKPGLSGLWQVMGRSNLTWEETIELDLYYVDNRNTTLDLSIFFRTFKVVLSRDGAY